jgi:isoquinoline 1-oxidoreductase alpha subunit
MSPDVSHPCQRAWTEEDVAQCGYCQAGMFFATGKRIRKLPIHAKDLA